MERALRPLVFTLCLAPLLVLVYATASNNLGPDPAEQIMHVTGEWALRLLLLTLLMSPLRHWSGSPWPLKLRRMLGLYAFFYACVHLATFGHFYIGWTLAILTEELAERPYVLMGFSAWLLLLPLAVTSTRRMQRRLGRAWRRLHQLVYLASALACVHLLWLARSDIGEALLYSSVTAGLLLWRLRHRLALTRIRAAGP